MSGSCSGYSNRTVRRLGLVSATATPDFCSAPSTAARTAPTVSPDCGGRGWRSSRTTSATERGKSPARRGPERCLARTSGTADCCRAHPPIIRTGSRNRTNVALIRMQLVRTPGRPEQADNRLMLPVLPGPPKIRKLSLEVGRLSHARWVPPHLSAPHVLRADLGSASGLHGRPLAVTLSEDAPEMFDESPVMRSHSLFLSKAHKRQNRSLRKMQHQRTSRSVMIFLSKCLGCPSTQPAIRPDVDGRAR